MTWRDTFASLPTEDKIAAAILCAWPTTDSIPWRRWAAGWLTGRRGNIPVTLMMQAVPCPPYWALLACWSYDPVNPEMVAGLPERSVSLAASDGIDPSPILDDIAAGDLQKHVDRAEQELAIASQA